MSVLIQSLYFIENKTSINPTKISYYTDSNIFFPVNKPIGNVFNIIIYLDVFQSPKQISKQINEYFNNLKSINFHYKFNND